MAKRMHGLKKIRLRQSWNKYNLYNLSRATTPFKSHGTFFQQKWASKAATRAYHGEVLREKQWQRMFRPTMRSVVSMNPVQLASTDGSEQASGRGSGKDVPEDARKAPKKLVPYMNMVFAPIERRLDTAIFRAMFASSTRQARQFVIHGYVKVNGKSMIYPGYQLNPGDMFQVEPERVLFATGAPKERVEVRALRKLRKKSASKQVEREDTAVAVEDGTSSEKGDPGAASQSPKERVKAIIASAKAVLESEPSASAKRKQALREFTRQAKKVLSKPSSQSTVLSDSLDAQFLELTSKLNISDPDTPATTSSPPPSTPDSPSPEEAAPTNASIDMTVLNRDERRAIMHAIREMEENPFDPLKPYATPWRPRNYMAPFAFIPRYLEVHHKICSAVYLRHPVARPGFAEVPTPFSNETNELAFNWYLRRR